MLLSEAERGPRARLHAAERICLGATAVVAALTFFGGLLALLGITLPFGGIMMRVNTATAMLLAAAGMALGRAAGPVWRARLASLCAGLVTLLALLPLVQHVTGQGAHLDLLLEGDAGARPGLMPAQTALGLLFLGLLMPWSAAKRGAPSLTADGLTLLLASWVMVMLLGYVLGTASLFGHPAGAYPSPQALLCFLLLTAVAVMRRAESGLFSVLRGDHIGSRIARIAIPLALALPLLLSLLRAYAVDAGWLTAAYASAVAIAFACLCITALVLALAWRINALELEIVGLMQQRAREQLEESEHRYTELVEQSITGFVVRRPDGQLILVNEAYCRMTGYSREELLRLSARDMVVDPSVLERVARLKPGESAHVETLMRCKGGALREVEYVTQRRRDGNLQSVLLDVSDRKRIEKEREESEHRYTELVEQAADSIWLRSRTGQMLVVNQAACTLLGYTRAELLSTNSPQLIHPTDPGTAARIDALRPGETLRLERVMRHKDGHAIPVEASVRRLLDGSTQVVSHDIGERQRIEQARRESERRYAELVDQALEGILVRRSDGRFVFVNEVMCRMFGYTRGEMLDMTILDLVHPEDRHTIAEVQKLKHGGHVRIQKRMLRKDGSVVYVEVSAKRLQNGDIQTTVQDVSDRKHSELRFRSMVEGAPNAMVMTDRRGIIELVNPQTERLFGYARDELIGQPVEVLVPERFRAPHPRMREDYQRQPQMRAMGAGRDLYGLHKDGHEIPVEIGLNPIATPDGQFVLASIIDITERRAAEQRERAYTEELRIMSRRLSEAQETERRAIARELHDEIGQSLTATRIGLRGLEQQAAGGPLAEQLSATAEIIADLLGKVRQMSLDLHPSVLDDLGLAAALKWCVRTRAGGSGLNVTLDLPEDLPRFDGMAEITLFRVFQEALSNVLRHAEAKHFDARLRHDRNRLELTMKDDGRGFDAAAARKHALSGKSLGVVGMQERVRLAGGEIAVDSAPGRGTEIRVSLPLLEGTTTRTEKG